MSILRAATGAVVSRLIAAGCVAAAEEADELIAAAPDDESLEMWVRRREQGEPLPWILGTTRFGDRQLRVDPGVYVPRSQSEELARRAATLLPNGGRAVDFCTGSGAIAAQLIAARPAATVVGIDIDERAAQCARRNGVPVLIGDADAPLRQEVFDVVTAVAPYVPTGQLRLLPADVQRYEPRLALDGGDDGLDLVRRIVVAAARLLRRGGWLLIELGGEQDRALSPTLAASGFDAVTPWFDEDGDLRGLAARATGGDEGDDAPDPERGGSRHSIDLMLSYRAGALSGSAALDADDGERPVDVDLGAHVEQRARLMVKMANRPFKRNPSTIDKLAIRAVEKAARGEPRAMDGDLLYD